MLAKIEISFTAEICPALTRSSSIVKFNSLAREAIEDEELLFRLLLDMLKAPLLKILFELVRLFKLIIVKFSKAEISPELFNESLILRVRFLPA